jgi:hypothetical protein
MAKLLGNGNLTVHSRRPNPIMTPSPSVLGPWALGLGYPALLATHRVRACEPKVSGGTDRLSGNGSTKSTACRRWVNLGPRRSTCVESPEPHGFRCGGLTVARPATTTHRIRRAKRQKAHPALLANWYARPHWFTAPRPPSSGSRGCVARCLRAGFPS